MKSAALLFAFLSVPAVGLACEPIDTKVVLEMVRSIATEEELDPDLVLAVVDVESAGGKRQISEAGAMGVMQLMPDTAADYGVNDRCDPKSNIRAGVRYLKKLYADFDDPLLMLAAYNAGPERVYQKGGIPEFNETAQYIVKVMNRWKLHAKTSTAEGKRHPDKPHEGEIAGLAPAPWRDAHVWTAE